MNPAGVVVFGGNHVSHQGGRVLRECPAVDVVVNGEGEIAFHALVEVLADWGDLAAVAGITFRGEDGQVVTTAERERVTDLDVIPSLVVCPFSVDLPRLRAVTWDEESMLRRSWLDG